VAIQANGGYGRHFLTNCIDYVLTFLDCFVALWAPRNDGFFTSQLTPRNDGFLSPRHSEELWRCSNGGFL
jgi:hypothetical protein